MNRIVIGLAAASFVLAGQAAMASDDQPLTYYACPRNGKILEDTITLQPSRCPSKTSRVSWNEQGVPGPPGPEGPQGPPGASASPQVYDFSGGFVTIPPGQNSVTLVRPILPTGDWAFTGVVSYVNQTDTDGTTGCTLGVGGSHVETGSYAPAQNASQCTLMFTAHTEGDFLQPFFTAGGGPSILITYWHVRAIAVAG